MEKAILISFYFLIAISPFAHAYIDPGMGSYIFQIIIAAFLAAGFIIRRYWKRIRSFFNKKRETQDDIIK